MKTTRKDFELFKQYCRDYQTKFSLRNYRLLFRHAYLKDAYAQMKGEAESAYIYINFASDWKDRPTTKEEIKECAKHEMCHVLLERLRWLGMSRYIHSADINEEAEGLTNKLVTLIE